MLEKLKEILESRKKGSLILDNDCAYFIYGNPEDNSGFPIDMTQKELLEEALDLLGIPWKDC